MKPKPFDIVGLLLLVPLALFSVSPMWLPDNVSFGNWPYTIYIAISSVLLLPWLKTRVYPHESLARVACFEAAAVAGVAILEFLFRRTGWRIDKYVTILIGLIALVWFAIHERRKNQMAVRQPPG